jgi:4-hydroxybenzoate polyprenyltransferase
MAAGVALGATLSFSLAYTLIALWLMGIIYNVPPIRSKEIPYIDVLSEAVNNPLRLLMGWYVLHHLSPPPISLLVAYWMVGCYFMAIKRFAEYREIGDRSVSAAYRRSFAYYNEPRLLVSIMFYSAFAMLMLGAFIVRYRLEWILAVPLLSSVMALYLHLAFQKNSAAQNPEKLYKQPMLMVTVCLCAIVMGVCLFVDMPWLHHLFAPLEFGLRPQSLLQ